ncbi:HAD family hydrolase [Listeria seeligeri]|uniref:HAD family hydrolase n=1 Tax=Listeria seeligeri TaxID=1640 RepID=UPI0016242BFC|nr:HAD family hydrolase [Listeria seeligeri]MBC1724018.1 HAD family phosphatase [Listeria seeligeri]MBF2346986.1 HAD family phosphatase [Listeria seeligeri]MBF2437414.1 HAD family phosphatase [Listeria seeligeri]
MIKKLFVTDLDGTLVTRNNEIELADLHAIRSWQQQGNLWVVATGRKWDSVVELLQRYDLAADALILENGALILASSGEIIWQKNIQPETAKLVTDFDLSLVEEVCLVTSFNQAAPQQLLNLDSFKETQVISAITLRYATVDLAEEYVNQVEALITDAVFRNMNYIDIAPNGCSKGAAVKFLMERLMLTKNEVSVIGDSFNDISMFEVSRYPFTLEHAEKAMHEQGALVVKNVHEAINKVRLEWDF